MGMNIQLDEEELPRTREALTPPGMHHAEPSTIDLLERIATALEGINETISLAVWQTRESTALETARELAEQLKVNRNHDGARLFEGHHNLELGAQLVDLLLPEPNRVEDATQRR